MYELTTRPFKTFDGKAILFTYRQDTSDYNTVPAIVEVDEYGFRNFGLKDGDVVLDLGAHIGAATCFLNYLNPNLRIYAYEPLPENYALLKINMIQNRIVNGHIFRKAVMPMDNIKARIHYTTDKTENGKHHRFIGRPMKLAEAEWDETAFVTVEAITLEHILTENNLDKVKVVKMDIEGVEADVLLSTPPHILQKIEYITGEYHSMTRDEIYNPVKDYFDRVPTPYADASSIGHFLFRRKQ